jgi:hypothetical protein
MLDVPGGAHSDSGWDEGIPVVLRPPSAQENRRILKNSRKNLGDQKMHTDKNKQGHFLSTKASKNNDEPFSRRQISVDLSRIATW